MRLLFPTDIGEVLKAFGEGVNIIEFGFRRRDADGCDRDGRAPLSMSSWIPSARAPSPPAWLRAGGIFERHWHSKELHRRTRRGHRARCPYLPIADCGMNAALPDRGRPRPQRVRWRFGANALRIWSRRRGGAADGDVRAPTSDFGFRVYSVFNPWRLISGVPVGRVPPHGARTPLARRTGERKRRCVGERGLQLGAPG